MKRIGSRILYCGRANRVGYMVILNGNTVEDREAGLFKDEQVLSIEVLATGDKVIIISNDANEYALITVYPSQATIKIEDNY